MSLPPMQTFAVAASALLLWPGLLVKLLTNGLFLGYAGGVGLHWLLKASAIKATPASPITSRRAWLKLNRRALLVRWAIITGIFCAWCYDPAWVKDWLGIPLNPGTVFIYGFVFDNVLYLAAAKFKILDGQIPGYRDAPGLPAVQAAMAQVDVALAGAQAAQETAVEAVDAAAKAGAAQVEKAAPAEADKK